MQRQIKFRGRDLDTGEWTYGHFMTYDDRPSIQYTDSDGFNCYDSIDPETVGQYTGLKDNGGVEIFEGDIIDTFHEKWPKERPGDFRENGTPSREVKWITSEHHNGWNVYFGQHSQYEVIGNIYENPELLK